jgi:hypothetical protein
MIPARRKPSRNPTLFSMKKPVAMRAFLRSALIIESMRRRKFIYAGLQDSESALYLDFQLAADKQGSYPTPATPRDT